MFSPTSSPLRDIRNIASPGGVVNKPTKLTLIKLNTPGKGEGSESNKVRNCSRWPCVPGGSSTSEL